MRIRYVRKLAACARGAPVGVLSSRTAPHHPHRATAPSCFRGIRGRRRRRRGGHADGHERAQRGGGHGGQAGGGHVPCCFLFRAGAASIISPNACMHSEKRCLPRPHACLQEVVQEHMRACPLAQLSTQLPERLCAPHFMRDPPGLSGSSGRRSTSPLRTRPFSGPFVCMVWCVVVLTMCLTHLRCRGALAGCWPCCAVLPNNQPTGVLRPAAQLPRGGQGGRQAHR